jgi:O-acetylhomoserine (thiol)-lyase
MRSETIALHGGYDVDPVTRAVAVPIYQMVAYAFDSAEHGAALFNLEVRRSPLQSNKQSNLCSA